MEREPTSTHDTFNQHTPLQTNSHTSLLNIQPFTSAFYNIETDNPFSHSSNNDDDEDDDNDLYSYTDDHRIKYTTDDLLFLHLDMKKKASKMIMESSNNRIGKSNTAALNEMEECMNRALGVLNNGVCLVDKPRGFDANDAITPKDPLDWDLLEKVKSEHLASQKAQREVVNYRANKPAEWAPLLQEAMTNDSKYADNVLVDMSGWELDEEMTESVPSRVAKDYQDVVQLLANLQKQVPEINDKFTRLATTIQDIK